MEGVSFTEIYVNFYQTALRHITQHSNILSQCRENLLFDFLTLEDGTDMLSRNVGKELALFAA